MKVRDILKIDDFDPLDVDITYLKKVSNEIPQEGYIDPAMAERLATVCLTAADKSADLLAQATLYLSHCDSNRRSAKAEAIGRGLAAKIPATLAKDMYASDPEYKVAANKYDVALGWHVWLETKRDTLIKTHHLCKDLVRKFDDNMSTSWDPGTMTRQKESSTFATKISTEDDTDNSLKRKVGEVSWTK